MEMKLQLIQGNENKFNELYRLKRDLTRTYTGSESSKILGYILAGLVIFTAIASILF